MAPSNGPSAAAAAQLGGAVAAAAAAAVGDDGDWMDADMPDEDEDEDGMSAISSSPAAVSAPAPAHAPAPAAPAAAAPYLLDPTLVTFGVQPATAAQIIGNNNSATPEAELTTASLMCYLGKLKSLLLALAGKVRTISLHTFVLMSLCVLQECKQLCSMLEPSSADANKVKDLITVRYVVIGCAITVHLRH
jgi:hypothetical protein